MSDKEYLDNLVRELMCSAEADVYSSESCCLDDHRDFMAAHAIKQLQSELSALREENKAKTELLDNAWVLVNTSQFLNRQKVLDILTSHWADDEPNLSKEGDE